MRARSAAATYTDPGSLHDRYVRALSDDWEPTGAIKQRAGCADRKSAVSTVFLGLEPDGIVEVRQFPGGTYLWRRGALWQSAYGGEG